MSAMYGHAWASQYGTQPQGVAADTWAASLSGLSGQQLATGLQRCIAEGAEFPPSAPRFRLMCFDIPSFEAVRNEITRADTERSPFCRMVWSFVDGHVYRQTGGREAVAMLRAAYDRAVEERMHGAPLPQAAAAAIEQQARLLQPANPEHVRDAIAEANALLGIKPVTLEDGTTWADPNNRNRRGEL